MTEKYDPEDGRIWLDRGNCYLVPHPNGYVAVEDGFAVLRGPDILLRSGIVRLGERTCEGHRVLSATPSWREIAFQLADDPEFRFQFAKHSRKFEEFLAATYRTDDWSDVILTPSSGDHGIDVIASRSDVTQLRVVDQAKAYARRRPVRHGDVREMIAVLAQLAGRGASKAILTTTSTFAGRVRTDSNYAPLIPFRLQLRDGEELLQWLADITARKGQVRDFPALPADVDEFYDCRALDRIGRP